MLLEKPISESLPQAESLGPLVKADSSNLMIGHIVLFNTESRALRDEAARIIAEDTPHSVPFQLDLLRAVGFHEVELIHKNSCYAAFGAVKR